MFPYGDYTHGFIYIKGFQKEYLVSAHNSECYHIRTTSIWEESNVIKINSLSISITMLWLKKNLQS